MKNKFKNVIVSLLVGASLFEAPTVYAMGNAVVSFESDSTVTVGEIFTVKMNVDNIENTYDGIVSMGGNLSFDDNKLEYVSSKGTETPYLFQINEDYDYKIAGLDFTLDNGIKSKQTVYEFTFIAKEEGTTEITLTNAKLTDSKDYITAEVITKEINVISNETIDEYVKTADSNVELNNSNINSNIINTNINQEEVIEETKEVINTYEEEIESEEIIENNISKEKKLSLTEKITQNITNFINKILNLFR